jgi:type I restriction enzyme, S subunit
VIGSISKPYPTYRDSGLPWVGKVPEHWALIPNRAVLRRRKTLVGTHHTDFQLLSLTKDGVIVRDVASGKGKFSADMGTSQEVHAGDLVFCLFDIPETPRTLGLSRHDGMITGAYTVFECSDPMLSRFLELFYQAMDDRKLLSPLYSGLRNTIPPTTFLGTKSPIPPKGEQSAIVRFVDHVDRLIRQYIRTKKKLIALLNEQKQAIIHQAVTRGLDPNVKLKPSGVEWLGDVPVHWEVVPIKRAFISMDYGISKSATDDGTIRLLTMGHIKNGRVTVPSVGGVNNVESSLLLNDGELLFNRTNSPDLVGKVGLFAGAESPVTFASYLVRMKPLPTNEPEYFNLLLNDFIVLAAARREAIPSLHQSNLNATRYGRLPIALPASEEQQSIVDWLKVNTRELETATSTAEREIYLLQEYRIRLIADVVTGKLDVREAAAQSSDGLDKPLAIDETDEFTEVDEDMTGTELEKAGAEAEA